MDRDRIERGVRLILEGIGEDPDREGLAETPARVARAYEEICGGMGVDPARELGVTFDAGHHDVVCVRGIEFYSLCEHHLLPFFGQAHVAYLPGADGRVCGISKLARVVEDVARRPQIQERLTSQVADAIERALRPEGVLVVVSAEHLCMTMRGVRKPGARTVTSVARGAFESDPDRLSAAMTLIGDVDR
ncbi:MAG: GTP cyclohydrolase I FolE [Coriobacteriales bacterium]|jgi:GTP cyclohydrolase I